jgi:deazaflavin-dependent oxidoreductase (nitroreductase family)
VVCWGDGVPIPRVVARLNRVGFNRVSRHVAAWLPGFGVVVHRGRRSGRTYRTPVNVFRADGGFLIALTYGADSDWVKNVVAAGEAELLTRRRRVRVTAPRVYHDESRRGTRPIERQALRLLGVADFLSLAESAAEADPPAAADR